MERKSAAGVTPTTADYVCPERYGNRIPQGMLSIIAGWPGEGKSTASRDLAAAVSRAGGRVAMANAEDPEGACRLGLDVAGADLSLIDFIEPAFPRDIAAFCDMIVDDQLALIVLDPIAAFFGGLIYQEAEFRMLFRPIREALQDTGCALLGIHHTISRIRAADHPLKALGGPQGSLKGTARSIWLFGSNPESKDERVIAHVKDNCGTTRDSLLLSISVEDIYLTARSTPASVPKLDVLDQECTIKAETLIAANSKTKTAKDSACGQWLTEFLCLGEQTQRDVFVEGKLFGFARATVQRSAQELNLRKWLADGVAYWALPADHPALLAAISDDDINNWIDGDGDDGEA